MSTNIKTIEEMLKNNKPVLVKFNSNVYDYNEEKFDENMIVEIISMEERNDGSYEVIVDGSKFEDENRKFAKCDWFDKDGHPTLCWFDTPFYPKDGKDVIYIVDEGIPFDLIPQPSDKLFAEYNESKFEGTYTEFLEKLVLSKEEL